MRSKPSKPSKGGSASMVKKERKKSTKTAKTKDIGVSKSLAAGVHSGSSKKAKKAAAREAAYAIIGGRDAAANKSKVGAYKRVGSK